MKDKQRNRAIAGAAGVILGGLIALGPQYVFKICEQTGHHGGVTQCFWTGRAEMGVGALIAVIGIVYLLTKDARVRAGLSIAASLSGALSLAVIDVLIGVCGEADMSCRLATLPAINIVGIITAFSAAANAFYLLRRQSAESGSNG
ncbi:MAG: DUF4418 family protein [Synergistaceae bacterium]|jgi:cellobiose-specific phosphotransferase system component IIC|nr:DUF4418 family protein [Synergistaceae bacterium]